MSTWEWRFVIVLVFITTMLILEADSITRKNGTNVLDLLVDYVVSYIKELEDRLQKIEDYQEKRDDRD